MKHKGLLSLSITSKIQPCNTQKCSIGSNSILYAQFDFNKLIVSLYFGESKRYWTLVGKKLKRYTSILFSLFILTSAVYSGHQYVLTNDQRQSRQYNLPLIKQWGS